MICNALILTAMKAVPKKSHTFAILSLNHFLKNATRLNFVPAGIFLEKLTQNTYDGALLLKKSITGTFIEFSEIFFSASFPHKTCG